ncbi:MAG TPA: N-acetylmuramoyl-L-alanine amidase, partial [Ferruginibacter sp.]|nr:N-acetylmuramoyl-L-alanine amidase [Ferruginibacter sp.]
KVIVQIVHLLKTNSSKYINDVVFVESNAKGTPFSFFKFIFWNSAIDLYSETGQQIFAHELAHVREKHSADKLFLNIVLIVCWINPIFWLIKKELNLIHEFIADKKAVANNDASALAAMIVTSAYPKHAYLLTNHFFYSPIKRRLQMLSKYNTTKAGYFYRILALPVVLFFVAAFTIKTKTSLEKIINPANKITVVIDAGHGGSDGGAIAVDGTLEKDINLDILKKIKALNKSSNINLVFTRELDIYQSPLEKAAFIKQTNADLFISIHIATGPSKVQQTVSGLEIYVSNDDHENSSASKLFASSLISHFKNNYDLAVSPNPVQRKVGIAVLKASAIPSVIIEPGYINNPTDLIYLKSAKGKEKIAQNILNAIGQYADNINNKTSIASVLTTKADTLELPKNNLGTYNGKKIKRINIIEKGSMIELILSNGESVKITSAEATKRAIALPTTTAPNAALQEFRKTDASQHAVINIDGSIPSERQTIVSPNLIAANPQPLVILDGKEIPYAEMNNINPGNIEAVNVLKGEGAIKKYGAEKSINGVIEITSKEKYTVNIQTPTITLSGITGPKIDIDNLKKIKEVNISMNDYSFESANVYFSGPGFKNVIVIQLNNKSLQSLKQYLERIEVGTVISFDNIRLLKNDGSKIEIAEKSFIFYEGNQQEDVTVFNKLEQEATFPGGAAGWSKYLRENLNANMPVDEGWSGGTFKVIVRFVVSKDGSISDVVAENYIGTKTAQMCVDFIKNGPKWIPGRQNNRVVNSYKKQPITFVVQEQ